MIKAQAATAELRHITELNFAGDVAIKALAATAELRLFATATENEIGIVNQAQAATAELRSIVL